MCSIGAEFLISVDAIHWLIEFSHRKRAQVMFPVSRKRFVYFLKSPKNNWLCSIPGYLKGFFHAWSSRQPFLFFRKQVWSGHVVSIRRWESFGFHSRFFSWQLFILWNVVASTSSWPWMCYVFISLFIVSWSWGWKKSGLFLLRMSSRK